MSAQRPEGPATVTDFGQYAGMRAAAQRHDPKALRQAAQQFEALLTETLLKTSRQTRFGDDLTGTQGDFYNDLFDQQMALHLSAGKGLGLADMLVRQLGGLPAGAAAANGAAEGAPAAAVSDPRVMLRASQRLSEVPATRIAAAAANLPVTLRAAQGLYQKVAPATPSAGAAARTNYTSPPIIPNTMPRAADSILPKGAQGFVDAVRPHAEKAAAALGVPARVLIAQAALETGWGRHVARHPDGGYNLFGVKAQTGWSGRSAIHDTTEYQDGRWTRQQASFRAYHSIGAAFDDYVSFLKTNPRYAAALRSGDVHGFAHGLQRAGYATDPHYAQKLISVADRVRLDATPRGLSV